MFAIPDYVILKIGDLDSPYEGKMTMPPSDGSSFDRLIYCFTVPQALLIMLIGLLCFGIVVIDFTINPLPTAAIPDGATEEAPPEDIPEAPEEVVITEPLVIEIIPESSEESTIEANGESPLTTTAEITAAVVGTDKITPAVAGIAEAPTIEPTEEAAAVDPAPKISASELPIVQFDHPDNYTVKEQAEEFSIIVKLEGAAPNNSVIVDLIIKNSDDEIITKPLVLQKSVSTFRETFEDDEIWNPPKKLTLKLKLSDPNKAQLGDKSEDTLTIIDNDEVTVGFSRKEPLRLDEAKRSEVIKVKLNIPSTQKITVDYEIDSDSSSAAENQDYSFVEDDRTLVFDPGDIEEEFTLDIKDNNEVGDTKIILILRPPEGEAKLNPERNKLELIIKDDDG